MGGWGGGWGEWIGESGKVYLTSIYVAVHVGDFENEYPAIQCENKNIPSKVLYLCQLWMQIHPTNGSYYAFNTVQTYS